MRIYVGRREPISSERWHSRYGWNRRRAEEMVKEGQTEPLIYVQESGGDTPPCEYELRHHPLHSPDGFDWGYSGSGPTDAARCILIHYLGIRMPRTTKKSREVYVPHYRDFKLHFLSEAPEEGFTISEEQIDAWARAQGLDLPAPRPSGRLRTSLLAR